MTYRSWRDYSPPILDGAQRLDRFRGRIEEDRDQRDSGRNWQSDLKREPAVKKEAAVKREPTLKWEPAADQIDMVLVKREQEI